MAISAAALLLTTTLALGLLLWSGDAAPALADVGGSIPSGMGAGKQRRIGSGEDKPIFMTRPNQGFPMPTSISMSRGDRADSGDSSRLIPLDPESVSDSAEVDYSPISPPPQQQGGQQGLTKLELPPPDAVVPKLTGHIKRGDESEEEKWRLPAGALGASGRAAGAIANPALYFMEGADLENISPPKCRLTGCSGPVPNDHDFMLTLDAAAKAAAPSTTASTCHQTFVPLNSCFEGGKGYPVGMVCTICCECSVELETEMRKSRGYRAGMKANLNTESR